MKNREVESSEKLDLPTLNFMYKFELCRAYTNLRMEKINVIAREYCNGCIFNQSNQLFIFLFII